MTDRTESRMRRVWREWGAPLLAVLVVMGSFRSAIADWNDVPTGSMRPTILDGDRIFLSKMAYDLRVPFAGWRMMWRADPERGDIVIFPSPLDGKRYVKRIIGLPGDEIRIDGDRLWINGVPASYEPADPQLLESIPEAERNEKSFWIEHFDGADEGHLIGLIKGHPATRFGPYVVPPGRYFCAGDNRHNSLDSRVFGAIDRAEIQGQALAVAASLDPDDMYLPRWARFFHGLR